MAVYWDSFNSLWKVAGTNGVAPCIFLSESKVVFNFWSKQMGYHGNEIGFRRDALRWGTRRGLLVCAMAACFAKEKGARGEKGGRKLADLDYLQKPRNKMDVSKL